MSTKIKQKLIQALSSIDRPGSFCTSGSLEPVLPGLEVTDLGPIGLPLVAQQAKALQNHCEQAPYGKGERTLFDTGVRRVWRLPPDRFRLTNPAWNAFVEEIVGAVQEDLGLEKQRLHSHLHELLLYEKGCFFLPHRDGEKLDRMVATLVISLPSSYRGGELVVRHEGQEETLDFKAVGARSFLVHYAAFYTDCEHEVRPLKQGYRLCLIYNLTLAKPKTSITAPRRTEHITAVRGILQEWAKDRDTPPKLAVTLGHEYTEKGLTWDALKGVDRVKAEVLREAARQAGWAPHLALLTLWEMGSPEGYDYQYGVSNEMEEVYESSLTADHWVDADGARLKIGVMSLDESEILDLEQLHAVEPEEEFEGYTGNAGMTLDHWYRHAAVVLWLGEQNFQVLCEQGGQNAVSALEPMIRRWRKARGKTQALLKERSVAFARAILESWEQEDGFDCFWEDSETDSSSLLAMLVTLDEPALIRPFLAQVMVKDVSVDPGESLVSACAAYGWETFQPELTTLFEATRWQTLLRNIRLFQNLCLVDPGKKTERPAQLRLGRALAATLLAALERVDRTRPTYYEGIEPLQRSEVLAGLATSLLAVEAEDLLPRLVDHALAKPKIYPLTEAHVVAWLGMRLWLRKRLRRPCSPLARWLEAVCQRLEVLTAEEPREPADFRREAKLPCQCEHCRALKRFLRDPREEVGRFSVREELRRHLSQIIREAQCDVECETERRGSPFTLVCTKNDASYWRKLGEYHLNKRHLKQLRAIQKELS